MSPAAPAAPVERVSGPAFGLLQRVLAALMAAALTGWCLYAWRTFTAEGGGAMLWLAALIIVQWSAYWIWNSTVTVDDEAIAQTWVWKKVVRKEEIASLNIVHARWLEWLITPRVVIRTSAMMMTTFPLACPKVRAFVQDRYPLPTGHL